MNFLDVRNLTIKIRKKNEYLTICQNIDLSLNEGEVFGLVGNTDSGKSLVIKALIGMYGNNLKVTYDRFVLSNKNITNLSLKDFRKYMSKHVAVIFQNAKSTLSPKQTIAQQMCDALPFRSFNEVWYKYPFWRIRMANNLLHRVGIKDTKKILLSYPHQLSNLVCQKIAIAMAIGRKPKLLLADDPISGMTSFAQLQILRLLASINQNSKTTILYTTNDFSNCANFFNRIAMFYNGEIMEIGITSKMLKAPHHPFTSAMINIAQRVVTADHKEFIPTIPGTPPDCTKSVVGCIFGARCPFADSKCNIKPKLVNLKNCSYRCHFPLNIDKDNSND